jgi:hypothetical protein
VELELNVSALWVLARSEWLTGSNNPGPRVVITVLADPAVEVLEEAPKVTTPIKDCTVAETVIAGTANSS